MKSNKLKILCIFGRLLGNKVTSNRLEKTLTEISCVDPTFWYFDWEDYFVDYKMPKVYKISDTLEGAMTVRYKYKKHLDQIEGQFDALFFLTFWLPLGFPKLIKKMPVVVALDSNPVLSHDLLQKVSDSQKEIIRSRISSLVSTFIFKKVFKNIDIFLPLTQWCADSLITDFNVNPVKINKTLLPVDLSLWKPLDTKNNNKVVLLFVGNDFKRKGGEFIVELYERYLAGFSILRIVSNDDCIKDKKFIDGVEIIQDISHENIKRLINIYQTSDIFVFPTRKDQLGLVLIEAMSTGLPVISTDVGGTSEIVRHRVNGYLMPYELNMEDWAEKIRYLSENVNILKEYGDNSRKIAEEEFSIERFDMIIENTIEKLVSMKRSRYE